MSKHPTTNSLGKPIASTPQAITNFWKWFGNSKVVDKEGRPMVVYHGSKKMFDIFKSEPRFEFIYFAKNKKYAEKFQKENGELFEVYLKIEDPFDAVAFGIEDYTNFDYQQQLKSYGIKMEIGHKWDTQKFWEVLRYQNSLYNEFIAAGYDGVLFQENYDIENTNKKDTDNWTDAFIVFSPNQIKSATGNNGNFDSEDGSILNGIEEKSFKNQFEINKSIEDLVYQKGDSPELYTEKDKEFIRRYSGSGGLANQGATGKGILYEFFTPEYICELMYKLATAHGYDGGNILEPSCGTGELIRPAADYTKVTGFEINKTSAAITRILYPGAQVYADYFETAFMQAPRFTDTLRYPNKTWLKQYPFSLVIGNPPYGRYQSFFSKYFNKKLFTQVEIFFIIQGIELLKPGGLMVYLQSSNFLRNGDKYTEAKEYLDKIADFVDAYRLPSVFKYSEVPTDIMVLRKKLK